MGVTIDATAEPVPQGPKRQRKALTWAYGVRSFVGYLEGTGKSLHTISSYRSDLNSFGDFLQKELSGKPVHLKDLTPSDLDRYGDHLIKSGQRINTRRRKLLTVRRFIKYLEKRNKMTNVAAQLPAPHKMERIPKTVDLGALEKKISEIDEEILIARRNKLLLLLLVETGALVSEAVALRTESFRKAGKKFWVSLGTKETREVELSREAYHLYESVKADRTRGAATLGLFVGFNRFGPMNTRMSARGLEMLVKSYREKLEESELTPRMIRHSVAVSWLRSGVEKVEVKRRLALRSDYAFRAYELLVKSAD